MQCPTNNTERVHLDITVLPTNPPPQPITGPTLSPELLAIMQKYKYNWRLDQLAKPKWPVKKYQPTDDFSRKPKKVVKIKDEIKFFADQLAWPKLRTLYINKGLFGHFKGYERKFSKNINKAWGTIYNFYKKRAKDRRLRELRRQQKIKGKKPEINQKRHDELAQPKHVFKPEPKKKPSKLFTNFDHLDELAAPKPYHIEPPLSLGKVNPHALTYEPTEIIIRLAKVPDRILNQPKPLEPGKVKRSALKYKVTPTIEKLAQPKQRNEKSKEEEEVDPWAISKNALKYKATPRIIELAKPVERD